MVIQLVMFDKDSQLVDDRTKSWVLTLLHVSSYHPLGFQSVEAADSTRFPLMAVVWAHRFLPRIDGFFWNSSLLGHARKRGGSSAPLYLVSWHERHCFRRILTNYWGVHFCFWARYIWHWHYQGCNWFLAFWAFALLACLILWLGCMIGTWVLDWAVSGDYPLYFSTMTCNVVSQQIMQQLQTHMLGTTSHSDDYSTGFWWQGLE